MPRASAPNPAIAELISCLGEEDARELVRMFLKSFEVSLESLGASNHEEKRRIVHGVKSSSRIIGVLPLSRWMRELEERVAAGGGLETADLARARELFAEARPPLAEFVGDAAP